MPKQLIAHDQIIRKGDIIFAMSSGSINLVGKSAQALKDIEGSFGAFCGLLRPCQFVSDGFLANYFQENSFKLSIKKIAKGTNINNLKREHILLAELPLPPLNEQHRIVAKIEELFSELEKGVESLKAAKAQLAVYRQSVLKAAFEGRLTEGWRKENASDLESATELLARIKAERESRHAAQLAEWQQAVDDWQAAGGKASGIKKPTKPKPPKELPPLTAADLADLPALPDGWGRMRLGNFIEGIDAGKSFKCDEREPSQGEIGVAKVSAVTWGEYDESESKTCTDPSKVNEAYFINAGDFLFSRANTIELVGACVIAKGIQKKVMLSDKTLRIDFNSRAKGYFLYYLRSRMGRNEIERLSTGNQDSMRNIGQERICSIVLPACSEAEMLEVVQEIESRFSVVEKMEQTIEESLQKAEALRQSILKRAFEGKLVPQNPDDEPAAELLARIRAERAKIPASKRKQKEATA